MAQIWHRTFRDVFSYRRLWLFPLLAGFFWFLTLSTLLIRWLSIGQPRYPGQVNPDVPFISDIAAQTFKPVFIVGSLMTGLCFFGTMFVVHHVRYSPKFYGFTDDAPWRQAMSLVALIAGLSAAASLLLLSIYDTDDAHVIHRHLLMSNFAGLFVSAMTTMLVWWDQTIGPVVFAGLRKWCILNLSLVFCQFVAGILFLSFMYTDHYRVSGILEWTLCYLGSFWLLSFVGYARFREGERPSLNVDEERRPLLS